MPEPPLCVRQASPSNGLPASPDDGILSILASLPRSSLVLLLALGNDIGVRPRQLRHDAVSGAGPPETASPASFSLGAVISLPVHTSHAGLQ